MDLENLSLKEKVGQKFMFGINSHNIDIIIDLIKNYSIGGVILYKKNYNNYKEMISVIKRLKKANSDNKFPLFIAIDQEGGRVNRMPSEFNNLKNIYDVSSKDIKLVYEHADIVGEMLYGLGINMNFAPVLDINEENKSKVLYNRCFYGNEDNVISYGKEYVKGLSNNGLIPVIKHFPGHGVSMLDSHWITPYVYNFNNVLDKHIKPFDKIISYGIDAVMINHLVIRKLTKGLPASISYEFINEYLRKRNKFNGLVITDEINMLSRNLFYRFNYMKKAICSASDIILVKLTDKSGSKVIDKCIKLFDGNKHYKEMLDDSVNRIINVKKKYNITDEINYIGSNVDNINKRISKLNDILNKKC